MATIDVKDAAGATVALEKPLVPGRAAAASSRPIALSTEDFAVIDGLETAVAATNTAIASTNTKLDTVIGHVDGVETAIASTNTKLDTVIGHVDGQETLLTAINAGWGFDVAVAPTVTSGAYAAGDIVGALLDFAAVARANDEAVIITGVQVVCKAAVVPAWTLILFNADPTGTTKTDNAAYSLVAADAFKAIKAIPVATIQDHGTPNSWSIDGLGVVAKPVSGARNLFGLLIDGTGVTLTSTSDIQVRLRGVGV